MTLADSSRIDLRSQDRMNMTLAASKQSLLSSGFENAGKREKERERGREDSCHIDIVVRDRDRMNMNSLDSGLRSMLLDDIDLTLTLPFILTLRIRVYVT
jgi:hypothetical protein